MKPYSYYQTTSISIPKKDDYTTIYYYRKGLLIGVKKQFEDYAPPLNCIEEQVLDEVSYNAHFKLYEEENLKLQNEFRKDLIEKYHMTHHPKANKLFDKAWEYASGSELWDVEDYFVSLIELFQEDESNANLFSMMVQ